MVLRRSSKQAASGIPTCEVDVAAAAQGFQVVEGLKSMLTEWGIVLDPPPLYQGNQSALAVIETGGTWRTRYFAVRAARLAEEHRVGGTALFYCPTQLMAAYGLATMGTA